MPELSNLLIPAVLFFAPGCIAQLIRSDLRYPPDPGKALSIYLLIAIGIHGVTGMLDIDTHILTRNGEA